MWTFPRQKAGGYGRRERATISGTTLISSVGPGTLIALSKLRAAHHACGAGNGRPDEPVFVECILGDQCDAAGSRGQRQFHLLAAGRAAFLRAVFAGGGTVGSLFSARRLDLRLDALCAGTRLGLLCGCLRLAAGCAVDGQCGGGLRLVLASAQCPLAHPVLAAGSRHCGHPRCDSLPFYPPDASGATALQCGGAWHAVGNRSYRRRSPVLAAPGTSPSHETGR